MHPFLDLCGVVRIFISPGSALYTALDESFEFLCNVLHKCMNEMIGRRSWKDSTPGLPDDRQSQLTGIVVFSTLSTLLQQCVTSFQWCTPISSTEILLSGSFPASKTQFTTTLASSISFVNFDHGSTHGTKLSLNDLHLLMIILMRTSGSLL